LSSAKAFEYTEQLAHWHTQLAGIVTVNGPIFHGSFQSPLKMARNFFSLISAKNIWTENILAIYL
jgi:hypothetical protein